ncbi:MAG: hypothetical protein HUU15_16020 [Candidatus Brocadiae bacterium]|nr:hypothetical protein [Candidatus Brocadiia bacterium]
MRPRVLPALLILTAGALSARALSLELFTDAEIVALSERIVVGTVESTATRIADADGDGREQITTFASFRVEQVLKGNDRPGDLLTLPMTGGTVGTETLTVCGVPLWTEGERLLLCLDTRAERRSITPIVGAIQGRWVILPDANGNPVATRSFAGAAYFAKDATGELAPTLPPPDQTEPLADLMARLLAEVNK